jgi:hypothetical protein
MVIRSKKLLQVVALVVVLGTLVSVTEAVLRDVIAGVFDPDGTFQVAGDWVPGLGCPDCAPVTDRKVRGLVLAKSAETSLFASGGATLKGVRGAVLASSDALGWDLRSGSACGAGAPRFNVVTEDDNVYFIGCSSPGPSTTSFPSASLPSGWTRMRFNPALAFNASNGFAQDGTLPGKVVKSIGIVFDEGQDTGPTFSGMAVLDNIFVNGVTLGQ